MPAATLNAPERIGCTSTGNTSCSRAPAANPPAHVCTDSMYRGASAPQPSEIPAHLSAHVTEIHPLAGRYGRAAPASRELYAALRPPSRRDCGN